MADIELVIKIDDKYLEGIKECVKSGDTNYEPWVAIANGTPLDKIRAEIEEKYGDYDICEWFEDYDYEENDISEYRSVGNVSDIIAIIDKYRVERRDKE